MKCLQRGTLILALGGLLLACGQKGPLVLPDAPKHKHSAPRALPAKPRPPAVTPGSQSPSGESAAPGVAPPAPPGTAPATPQGVNLAPPTSKPGR